jgi:hypothetical protein
MLDAAKRLPVLKVSAVTELHDKDPLWEERRS